MTCQLIQQAVNAHARLRDACAICGITPRTLQRWKKDPDAVDRRGAPKRPLPNQLTVAERDEVLRVVNLPEFRDLTPKEIVPMLVDRGIYLCSESTMYRVLREANQLAHRSKSKQSERRNRPREYVANGPRQVWSWDITYLRTDVNGRHFYLYLILDVWSRKIVGWSIHERESKELSEELLTGTCRREKIARHQLVLHADNGSPMKNADLSICLEKLGVARSHSRPRVSNDNAYSESMFRTVKYCTMYPARGRFASVESAREWMLRFEHWYNETHLHSGIRYVTPSERHDGRDVAILRKRDATYEQARKRHPERWSGATRNWNHIGSVTLNPVPAEAKAPAA